MKRGPSTGGASYWACPQGGSPGYDIFRKFRLVFGKEITGFRVLGF
jgi:hypothetical protein